MNRWLIGGAGGMLGRDLAAALRAAGADVTALTRQDLDITDEAAVRAALRRGRRLGRRGPRTSSKLTALLALRAERVRLGPALTTLM